MKKNIYILLLILLFNTYCFSQTTRFNNIYNNYYAANLANVYEYNNGYICLGGGRELINPSGNLRIILYHTDYLGNIIWEKSFGDETYYYYHGTRNSLIENTDGGYSLSGSLNNETNNICLLMKFDQNFDTLWTKLYFDNPDYTVFYNHIQTTDGGFALVGCTTESDADGDVLLVKTDSDGNMLWYKKYGTSGRDMGFCIVETPDNGFLIGGSCGLGNTDGYLVKTDSEGNQQWTRHYGNSLYPDGTIYTIGVTPQNEYILPIGYITTPISEPFYNRKYRFIKLDSDFNEVWNKEYGVEAEYTGIGTITVANDGDIWATVTDDNITSLFHLTPNGDSISKHYYSAEGSTGVKSLLSIKQTPDNGFIMAGVAYEPQVMWLVKTDSCGCVEEDCECGGNEVESILVNNEIEVYPNPASDLLFLQLHENAGDAEINIYDATGRLVKSEKLVNNQTAINIRTLTAGSYVLKVQFRDNFKTVGFIKN
ncbi:MAG TPA: T9SS type A sorting domain-containing protein [Bacteroidales bacterium]|nr:T9SS type A sorting domain-containing protein [Bacteroidales bacterium]